MILKPMKERRVVLNCQIVIPEARAVMFTYKACDDKREFLVTALWTVMILKPKRVVNCL